MAVPFTLHTLETARYTRVIFQTADDIGINECTLFPPFSEDFEQTYHLQHMVWNIIIYRSIKCEISLL